MEQNPAASSTSRTASTAWILRMAWRDTRTSRRRLLLYAAAITFGIGALVAIASLADSLREAVRTQSNVLLGADLVASSGEPFTPEAQAILRELGGRRADEMRFRSMVLFPRTGRSRLLSVHAVDDAFPFYGKIDTVPENAAQEFRRGRHPLPETARAAARCRQRRPLAADGRPVARAGLRPRG